MPIDIAFTADASTISIVSGAVLAALLDRLVESGRLSNDDVRVIFLTADETIGHRTKNDQRDRASAIIAQILGDLPQG